MTQPFFITRFLFAGLFFLVAFYLLFYWLWTGTFWPKTRGIDWIVYFLLAEYLWERKSNGS